MRLGEMKLAHESFKNASCIAPVHSSYQLTFAEYYRSVGDWNGYLICTRNALDFALNKKTIAQAYRNFAVFFQMQHLYQYAAFMYYLSLEFDSMKNFVKSQLEVLFQKANTRFNQPTEPEIEKLLEAYDIPYGANFSVLELALNMAVYFETTKRAHLALEMYEIILELTGDEEIHSKIRLLKKG
ncbi:MAG: hypothetical protein LBV67_03195 [Streptococcaceae bacterium]|nr:hypothetical protein [Streptococcaceae bacterium]